MASMGPYMEGEAVEYIAFLKDAYKYRLHSLLWSNQDRVAAFAASTRYVCVCVCVLVLIYIYTTGQVSVYDLYTIL